MNLQFKAKTKKKNLQAQMTSLANYNEHLVNK